MSNQSLLVAEGLVKEFSRGREHGVGVLSGLDFELEEGERVAILGKSGAGKSTFLHILGTLERPSRGRVLYQGKDVFSLGEAKLSQFRNRELGFVFQFHYLMLELNALENVMVPSLIAGEEEAVARKKAKDLLDQVGLTSRMTHKPSALSGGEQQRVAIARALMMRPKVLLTDEMTGNLDPSTAASIMSLVESLHREFNMAMVSVTHDEDLARNYPKIYQLTQGALSLVG